MLKVFSESPPPSTSGFPASLTVALPQDLIALARSTFASLENTDTKDIVIVGYASGISSPWQGQVELSESTWELHYTAVIEATVVFRSGMYSLLAS
jgi:hypothetical protein